MPAINITIPQLKKIETLEETIANTTTPCWMEDTKVTAQPTASNLSWAGPLLEPKLLNRNSNIYDEESDCKSKADLKLPKIDINFDLHSLTMPQKPS